jgi:Zn-dependent protease with chaperone function
MGFTPTGMIVTLMLGNAAGVLFGLGLTFGLAPFILRKMILCEALTETSNAHQFQKIEACFKRAGVKTPAIWIAKFPGTRLTNALIAGFQNGGGIFRPGLFLTQSLLERFSTEEQEAVLLHEVSHLSLSHLRKRLFLSLGAVILSGAFSVVVLTTAYFTLPTEIARLGGLAVPFLAFTFAFSKIREQMGRQELEADAYAVNTLGADLDSLVSALRKIDQLNGNDSSKKPLGIHPVTNDRIAKLEIARDARVLSEEWRKKDAA